jgi:hypothetical protein
VTKSLFLQSMVRQIFQAAVGPSLSRTSHENNAMANKRADRNNNGKLRCNGADYQSCLCQPTIDTQSRYRLHTRPPRFIALPHSSWRASWPWKVPIRFSHPLLLQITIVVIVFAGSSPAANSIDDYCPPPLVLQTVSSSLCHSGEAIKNA